MAALGIVNTLTMGVVERIREIGVLRAIGMTRRQAMRMVVVEAALLGIVGVVLGSLAGLGAGAVLLQLGGGLSNPGGIPWLPIGVAAVLGLVLPGRRGDLPGPRRGPNLDHPVALLRLTGGPARRPRLATVGPAPTLALGRRGRPSARLAQSE